MRLLAGLALEPLHGIYGARYAAHHVRVVGDDLERRRTVRRGHVKRLRCIEDGGIDAASDAVAGSGWGVATGNTAGGTSG